MDKLVYDKMVEILDDLQLDDYCDYYKKFQRQCNSFAKFLKNNSYDELHRYFEKNKNKFYEIYRNVLKGNIQSASTSMRNWLYKDNFISRLITEVKLDLFRCRKASDGDITQISQDFTNQMFHIPFNMRQKVGNVRYSISGFPCLYLGTSVDLCKAEVGITGQDTYFVAEFSMQNEMDCYDLVFAELNEKLSDLSDQDLIKKFIIVLASSFTINRNINEDVAVMYYPYYTIPQLITAAIASKDDSIRCVRYKSVLYEGTNYVFIPRVPNLRANIYYDVDLQAKFVISQYNESTNYKTKEKKS